MDSTVQGNDSCTALTSQFLNFLMTSSPPPLNFANPTSVVIRPNHNASQVSTEHPTLRISSFLCSSLILLPCFATHGTPLTNSPCSYYSSLPPVLQFHFPASPLIVLGPTSFLLPAYVLISLYGSHLANPNPIRLNLIVLHPHLRTDGWDKTHIIAEWSRLFYLNSFILRELLVHMQSYEIIQKDPLYTLSNFPQR